MEPRGHGDASDPRAARARPLGAERRQHPALAIRGHGGRPGGCLRARHAGALRPLPRRAREPPLHWWEGWRGRSRAAWLNFVNAKLRLTLPEAYRVHRDVIEWDAAESSDRIPDRALGASPLTLKAMRWAMQSWERIAFINRY